MILSSRNRRNRKTNSPNATLYAQNDTWSDLKSNPDLSNDSPDRTWPQIKETFSRWTEITDATSVSNKPTFPLKATCYTVLQFDFHGCKVLWPQLLRSSQTCPFEELLLPGSTNRTVWFFSLRRAMAEQEWPYRITTDTCTVNADTNGTYYCRH